MDLSPQVTFFCFNLNSAVLTISINRALDAHTMVVKERDNGCSDNDSNGRAGASNSVSKLMEILIFPTYAPEVVTKNS